MRFYETCLLIVLTLLGCGCGRENASEHGDLDKCVRAATESYEKRVKRIMRWVKPENVLRDEIDEKLLKQKAELLLGADASPCYKTSIPLYVRFQKHKELNVEDGADRGRDIDKRFDLDATLFGLRDSLLDNRLYFVFHGTNHVVVWSRLVGNVSAKYMGLTSVLKANSKNDSGEDISVFRVAWSALNPMFLGDELYGIDDFLKRLTKRDAALYWSLGKDGLYEGKHIYAADAFEAWHGSCDTLMPLKMVFATSNTVMLSLGEADMSPPRAGGH